MPAPLILIIEDDAHIGGLVTEVLREAGYSPMLSPNVNAARAQAASGLRPAAIISDLMVEGARDPATLANEIAVIFPGVPVTLMTGVPPKRRAHLGVTHDRILEKPFELEELLQAVESMLGVLAAATDLAGDSSAG
jgi:DNA-binding NtrC family response regulator